jgi:transcriptional regulator with XRE-family HTH domain
VSGSPSSGFHAAPHPTDVRVGQRLRQRRTMLGLSQERLGELLGVSYQQVQKYERGINRIGSSRLHEISAALDVPVAYFFEEDEPLARPAILPPGLAEGGSTFVFDGAPAAPAPAAETGAADGRETLELVRAFGRIGDPAVRRRLLELARALARAFAREDGRGIPDP